MATLKTKAGDRIIIDPEFYQLLKQFSWKLNGGYANTTIKGKFIILHRLLMGQLFAGPNVIIDHINGNKLDNRICNLQIVNHGQNSQKSKKQKEPFFIGVTKSKHGNLYCSRLNYKNKRKYKSFNNAIDAAIYYDNEVLRLQGKTALTNLKFYKDIVKKLAKKP